MWRQLEEDIGPDGEPLDIVSLITTRGKSRALCLDTVQPKGLNEIICFAPFSLDLFSLHLLLFTSFSGSYFHSHLLLDFYHYFSTIKQF